MGRYNIERINAFIQSFECMQKCVFCGYDVPSIKDQYSSPSVPDNFLSIVLEGLERIASHPDINLRTDKGIENVNARINSDITQVPDLEKIITRFGSAETPIIQGAGGKGIGLATNGCLLGEKITKEFAKDWFNYIQISFHSGDAKTDDLMTNNPGGFDHKLKIIHDWKDIPKISWAIQVYLYNEMTDEVPDLFDYFLFFRKWRYENGKDNDDYLDTTPPWKKSMFYVKTPWPQGRMLNMNNMFVRQHYFDKLCVELGKRIVAYCLFVKDIPETMMKRLNLTSDDIEIINRCKVEPKIKEHDKPVYNFIDVWDYQSRARKAFNMVKEKLNNLDFARIGNSLCDGFQNERKIGESIVKGYHNFMDSGESLDQYLESNQNNKSNDVFLDYRSRKKNLRSTLSYRIEMGWDKDTVHVYDPLWSAIPRRVRNKRILSFFNTLRLFDFKLSDGPAGFEHAALGFLESNNPRKIRDYWNSRRDPETIRAMGYRILEVCDGIPDEDRRMCGATDILDGMFTNAVANDIMGYGFKPSLVSYNLKE